MYWVLWKTKDNREHHRTFGRYGEEAREEDIKKIEDFCKKLWQDSIIKEDDKYRLVNMTVIDGKHISWEKEETKIVSNFKLTTREGEEEE